VAELGALMRIIGQTIATIPPDGPLFNTTYWHDHYMPTLVPHLGPEGWVLALSFERAPDLAFEKMAQAADDLAGTPDDDGRRPPDEVRRDFVSAMRVAAVLAYAVDYRIRALVMVNHPGIHGRMHTQPPRREDVWNFFAVGGFGLARGWSADMVACHSDRRLDQIAPLTRAREQDYVNLLVVVVV
jgi:hypothetical protein